MTHLAAVSPAVAPSERRLFTITQDERGRWVARDNHGLIEGVFVDQRAALRFALFECGRCGSCSAVIVSRPAGRGDPHAPVSADGRTAPIRAAN